MADARIVLGGFPTLRYSGCVVQLNRGLLLPTTIVEYNNMLKMLLGKVLSAAGTTYGIGISTLICEKKE
jgi:hypothetical protein